ncbi:DUF2225 domain-containing protein [Sediminispirochaeta bajacaliforniensis]|uniref:DUF2225 domain-containing protein n=1 Tax=Sediminispirochaeta bajacaliforniensis TaxID=148 RepID=UPI00036F22CD|nr:DUF2225 domain-containing protein [Sediminispirochaeta bajacaliforniensis]
MSDEQAVSTLTFFSKDEIECPVCGATFYREELRTGRGRLIAGELTDELRRLYEPSQKYGEVYPLIYTITVCPVCFYAAFAADFPTVEESVAAKLRDQQDQRHRLVDSLFPSLDFRGRRTLAEGTAGYILTTSSMDAFPSDRSPTIKQGLSSLRAAWLAGDLHHKYPEENYDYLANVLYNKARFFYTLAIEYEGDGHQSISDAGHLGPDLDKNYGYDGALYIAALLEYYHGSDDDISSRIKSLERAKRTVARIFGMGKASKNKPAALLEKAKELHSAIGNEVKHLQDSLG